jgi:lipopolysaccharide export LptBFGC system permease protein LptF
MVTGDTTTELFFKKYNMVIKLETDTPGRKNADLTPYEIIRKIETEKRNDPSLYLELHRRFSLPFLCIVLIFFGPPLSMLAGKTGKLGGLTLGLSVFTAYYILLVYGENLVRAGKRHYIGAWVGLLFSGFCIISFQEQVADEILQRYYKGILKCSASALGLALIFSLLDLVDKIDEFMPGKPSIGKLLLYAMLNLPKYLYYLLPTALLVCCLFIFSQASRSKELVTVKATGGRIKNLFYPFVILGFLFVQRFCYRRDTYTRFLGAVE